MDQSKVREIVEREAPAMIKLMAIDHWTLIFKYNYTAENTYAECIVKPDYCRATISFNPAECENEKDVITTLRHELFHVVLSPYDLYLEAVDKILFDPCNEAKVLGRVWTHVIEKAVVNLELMWERLRNEPRA